MSTEQQEKELAAANEFIASLYNSGEGTPRPGDMVVNNENFAILTNHMKTLGYTMSLFTTQNLRAAYNDAKALGLLTLVPVPVTPPPPPQIVEVQVAPPDRRSAEDKLRDAGVTPFRRNYRSDGDTMKHGDMRKAANDVLSAVFSKGQLRSAAAAEAQLPIDITDAELTANRRNISAEQIRDLGRRRSAAKMESLKR